MWATIVLSVLRRFGFSDDNLKDVIEGIFKNDINNFYCYVAPYILLSQSEITELKVYVYSEDEDNSLEMREVIIDENTGKGKDSGWYQYYGRRVNNNFQALTDNMLKYIPK